MPDGDIRLSHSPGRSESPQTFPPGASSGRVPSAMLVSVEWRVPTRVVLCFFLHFSHTCCGRGLVIEDWSQCEAPKFYLLSQTPGTSLKGCRKAIRRCFVTDRV